VSATIKLRDLYQASIRGLVTGQYDAEQINHWTNRPIAPFELDIQNTTVGVCEFKKQVVGYGQVDSQGAILGAVYVHPDHAKCWATPTGMCGWKPARP
jgi:hypothetical protein